MSDNLTQVMLEFSANFDSFDSALKRAESRATQASKLIEKDFKLSVADDKLGVNIQKVAKEQQKMAKDAAVFAANTQLLASKRAFELTKQAAQQKLAYSKLAAKLEDSQSRATQRYKLEVAKIASNIELINTKKRNGEITAAAAKASIAQFNAAKQAQKATLDGAKAAAKETYKAAMESTKVQASGLKKATNIKFDVKLDTLERIREASADKQTSTLLRPLSKMVDVLGDVLAVNKDGVKGQDKTRTQIKKESSVSVVNRLQGLATDKLGNAFKTAFLKEFTVDVEILEKVFTNILPSTRMVSADLRDFVSRFDEAAGSTKNLNNFISELVSGFADASQDASGLSEVMDKFTKSAKTAAVSYGVNTKEGAKNVKDNAFKIATQQSNGRSASGISDALIGVMLDTRSGKSVAQNLSKRLDKPVAERKNKIQDERLPNILARAKELQETSKIAKRITSKAGFLENALDIVSNDLEELILVSGGYAAKKNTGKGRAAEINKQFEKEGSFGKKIAVGNVGDDTSVGKLGQKMGFSMAMLRPNLRGYNKDAEEMAAQAVAALTKSPELKVKLVGESGGGYVVEEATRILGKLGFGDRVQGAGFGTPMMKGNIGKQDNYTGYLGVNKGETLGYEIRTELSKLGIVSNDVTKKNPKASQAMRGLEGHTIDNYYGSDEFRQFMHQKGGKKQEFVKRKDLAALQKMLKERIIKGQGGVAEQMSHVEENFKMSTSNRELFEGIQAELDSLATEASSGIYETLNTFKEALDGSMPQIKSAQYNGDVEYLSKLEPDLTNISLELKKLGLNASDTAQGLITEIESTISTIRKITPKSKDKAEMKAAYLQQAATDAMNQWGDLTDRELEIAADLMLKDLKTAENDLKASGTSDAKKEIITNLRKQQLAIRKLQKKMIAASVTPVDTSDAWGEDTTKDARLESARTKKEQAKALVKFKGTLDAPSNTTNPFSDPKIGSEKPITKDNHLVAIHKDTTEIVSLLKGTQTAIAKFAHKLDAPDRKAAIQRRIDAHKSGDKKPNVLGYLNEVGDAQKQLPVAQGKMERLALAGSKAIGGALLEATKDVYQLAAGTEAAAMAMFPLLKGVKTVTQVLGATAIAASVPGSGLLLEGAQAVIAPAIDLAATGISGMVGGVVEGAIMSASGVISGAIAESGVIGAASIAGALTSAGATIATSAGAAAAGIAGVGATGALTAGAVAVPVAAAVKGVNNGINNIMGDTSKARANGERVAKNLGMLAGAVQENFLATKSQLKSLAPAKGADKAQLQASYSKQVFLLKGQINEAEEALIEAKGDRAATRLIKDTRKKLLGLLKTREKQATSAGVEIVDSRSPDSPMRKVRQVTVVDEAINAGKKGAKLAKDFGDGFKQTISADAEFSQTAEDAANRAVKGFAKGQDSASPSKRMIRLAKDFKDGFVGTLQADGDFFSAARNAASHAIEGFNAPIQGATLKTPERSTAAGEVVGQGLGEAQKALSSLMAQLRLPGSGFGEFFRGIDKGFKATGAGATKLKLQIGALLTVGAFMVLKNQIMSVGKALFNTALEMEVVQKKMNSVNMGGQDPFKAFGASANKAGLSVKDYASNFSGMVQTMSRSVPNADKVFESITEGLNKRGVVGDAMTRSMEALSQISSKGVVSMEELRQQLGEALPGAMTIAADSMGMTNGQFMKMVESGEMLSSDFLPKFGMALNNVAGGDLPSLNTELQTAKNNIDGILAQSASTIPFTGALQSFNAVVSQSAEFLKLFVPLLGIGLVGAAAGALTVIAPMVLGISAVGAALSAAFTGGLVIAGIAAIGVAVAGLVQYLKGAGTEFDRIGEKMEKALSPKAAKKSRLAATGTIARLNDSLTSFFTPGQSSKFAEKETIEVRNQANRQIQKQQDSINKSAQKLTEDNITGTNKQVAPLVIEKQKLQIKLTNADALGLSQDAKKGITKSINDIDAEIKGIVEKNLGSELDINTTLKANLESKAILEADAKARGEDVNDIYYAQYQNFVKQEQVLKSMVAQFAAVAGFSNNQLKAQKEMNAILSLGTKVSEKDGVMETLAAYKELESLTTTMAGFDSASMVIDIAVKEGAVKEIESQISSIDAFVSTSMGTAQEQVINKAFKNGWKKATAREIADFKVQIESGALGEVDQAVVSMVESLEKKSELEKELGQTNIDLIKANRQLEQALLDLNDARLNQQIQGNQTEMSLIQLVADLQKMSPENSKEVFDAGNSNIDFRLQQQESLRNLSVSFRSFGESLTDAADNLKSGIASMNEEIRATAASLQSTVISNISAFNQAAGIEDKLGVGRLAELLGEKASIKASDKTASIERQQVSENKTDKRQIRDFIEQREALNRETDRASMEIVRAIESNNFDMKDLEVNFELSGLQLQNELDNAVRDVTSFERSTAEFNDRSLGLGQAPVDVDISKQKRLLAEIRTLAAEGADKGAIVQALYDLKVQQNADAEEFLSGIQATKVQGNQGLTQRIADITSLNKEKNAAFETQKGMEKERVEVEIDINADKIAGTLVSIKRNMKEAGMSAIREAESVGLGIDAKLATVGLGSNPYTLLSMESKRWSRDTLADIESQKRALKETLDILGEGGDTADNKLNIQASLNNSNIDAETKGELNSLLANVKSSEDFDAYIKKVKDSIGSLGVSERQVLANADEVEARATKMAKAKDLLAKNNTLTGEKQSFLDSVDTSRLSTGEERDLELAKKKLKIKQDTTNKIAQIDEDAMLRPDLYTPAETENRRNRALEEETNLLKKAQKEASILNDIYANMSSAGVDAIKSAILGIGEALISNKPKQEEQDKLDADYAERLSSLVEGYTGSAEELQYAKDQLDEQRDDIQDEIESKLSKTAQIFDVLKGALSGFAQSVAQVAAQMAATAAIKGIAGAFGGGGWGSLASSLIGGANMGGHAGVDVISNYSMGGTAGVANALALQAGIGKAMQKEGQGAMPIVVHKGEQILSTRNGDAQLFRALKAQGEWDNIKQANVSNYANGGTVGYSGASGSGSMMKRGMSANSNTYYSSNVTVVANDIGSFKKNEQQILRETEAAQTRSVRRGLG